MLPHPEGGGVNVYLNRTNIDEVLWNLIYGADDAIQHKGLNYAIGYVAGDAIGGYLAAAGTSKILGKLKKWISQTEDLKHIGKITGKLSKSQIDDIIEKIGKSIKNHPLRQEYENAVKNLSKLEIDLKNKGLSTEEIAKAMHQARRELGIKYKDLTPEPLLEFIYERNMNTYGDPLGPTYEWLIENEKTLEQIIESAKRPNADIDKLLPEFKEWLERVEINE